MCWGAWFPGEAPKSGIRQTVEIKHKIMGVSNVKAEHFNKLALKLVA